MQLRFIEYFVALAREQHFGRAAAACHVTQPTLSSGITALEDMLGGRKLIERDRRFVGLTDEGRAALPWAQQLLADMAEMRRCLEPGDGPLQGELRIGVIPAALPRIGPLVDSVARAHPGVTFAMTALTSRQIEAGLRAHELDAGITYLQSEPLTGVRAVSLYRERFVFAARAEVAGDRLTIGWPEAAALPLCLLPISMQNRRLLDAHLRSVGLDVRPRATADSYPALIAMAASTELSTIIPDSYAALVRPDGPVRVIEFVPPGPANEIGVVALDRPVLSPLAQTLLVAAAQVSDDL